MSSFKGNFIVGLLVGAALAVLGPIAAADVIAELALVSQPAPAQAGTLLHGGPQVVNRAGKSDRLHAPQRATGEQRRKPVILVGCDPAFSPLSKSAELNFAGRCVS